MLKRDITFQISLWNGLCMGAGSGMTWRSPIRIATNNSVYAIPETRVGFIADTGGACFFTHGASEQSQARQDISLGLYLGLTGTRVVGRDLVKWGLATHFVDESQLSELYSRITNGVTKETTSAEIDAIVSSVCQADPAGEGEIENLAEI